MCVSEAVMMLLLLYGVRAGAGAGRGAKVNNTHEISQPSEC